MCRRSGRFSPIMTCAGWSGSTMPTSPFASCGRSSAGGSRTTLRPLVREAYGGFGHPAVAPLKQLGRQRPGCSSCSTGRPWPSRTIALQLLGRLFDAGAGAARRSASPSSAPPRAIPARRRSRPAATAPPIDIFMLHPQGRVSEVQRRQMTTVAGAQRPQHRDRRHLRRLPGPGEGDVRRRALPRRAAACRRSTRSTGRGSWPRSSTTSARRWRSGAPERPVAFAVPTGNFGNVYAGYVARAHGAADRAAGRRYQPQRHPGPLLRDRARWRPGAVVPTLSARAWTSRSRATSSACCSSCCGRDGARGRQAMAGVPRNGRLAVGAERWHAGRARCSTAARVDEARRCDDHRRHPTRRPASWSTRTPRSASPRPRARGPRPAMPDGHAGDRPSGQVPRRRRARDRRPPDAAARALADLMDAARALRPCCRTTSGAVAGATFGRSPEGSRMSDDRMTHPASPPSPNGLTRRHRRAWRTVETVSRRRLGRRRHALRAGRASTASPTCSSTWRSRAPQRRSAARHRRGDRGGRRPPQRLHLARAHRLLRPHPGGRPGARASTSSPTSCSTRRFDADELERERDVVLQEIGQVEDTPDDIVFDHFQETRLSRPAARPPDPGHGRDRSRSLPREALVDYMARHYGAERLVLAAAGKVEHDAAGRAGRRGCSATCRAPVGADATPRATRGGDRREARDLEQVHLVLGFPGVAYRRPRLLRRQVLSTLLGGGMSSRLFQEVRENRGPVLRDLTASPRPTPIPACSASMPAPARTRSPSWCRWCATSWSRRPTPAGSRRSSPRARPAQGRPADGARERQRPLRAARAASCWSIGRPMPTDEIIARVDAVDEEQVAARRPPPARRPAHPRRARPDRPGRALRCHRGAAALITREQMGPAGASRRRRTSTFPCHPRESGGPGSQNSSLALAPRFRGPDSEGKAGTRNRAAPARLT